MDCDLAREAIEGGGAAFGFQPLGVLIVAVDRVDGLHAGRRGRVEAQIAREIEGRRVGTRRIAIAQAAHGGRQVFRAPCQGLDARTAADIGIEVEQRNRNLGDDCHDLGRTSGEAVHAFRLVQRVGEGHDVGARAAFGLEDAIGGGPHDGGEIVAPQGRLDRVDAHELSRRIGLGARGGNEARRHLAGLRLLAGGDGIFQVQDETVGPSHAGRRHRFDELLFTVAGDKECGAHYLYLIRMASQSMPRRLPIEKHGDTPD